MRIVGEASYSLYMTHALLLGVMNDALQRLHVDGPPTLKLFVFLALSLLLSWAAAGFQARPRAAHHTLRPPSITRLAPLR